MTSQFVAFLVVASSTDECYQDIQRTLVKFRYPSLNKRSKGVVVHFLVKQYRDTGMTNI
jgi:hypothetical protein